MQTPPKDNLDLDAPQPSAPVSSGNSAGGQGKGGGGAGGGNQPPQPTQAGRPPEKQDLATSYVMAQINQCFKSDRIFHGVVSSKTEFRNLLGMIGKVPFQQRGAVARNLGAIIELNPRLLQDTKVFESINTILRNLPIADRFFQETCGKIMLKVREALIKNRAMLDLFNPIMMEYSEVIRKFLSMVPPKPKGDFFSSLDEQILNFILGKITKEDKEKRQDAQPQQTAVQEEYFSDDDDTETEKFETKMQALVKMIFTDVLRLEPELVSAVIMSLVTQLPHGNMIIEDKALANRWAKSLQ